MNYLARKSALVALLASATATYVIEFRWLWPQAKSAESRSPVQNSNRQACRAVFYLDPSQKSRKTPSYKEDFDIIHTAESGDVLQRFILGHYFGSKNNQELTAETAKYNPGIGPEQKLKKGTEVYIPIDNIGRLNGPFEVQYSARDGETLRDIVKRAVNDMTRTTARASRLTGDTISVVPMQYATRNGLEIIAIRDPRNQLVAVNQVDSIPGDILKRGQEIRGIVSGFDCGSTYKRA